MTVLTDGACSVWLLLALLVLTTGLGAALLAAVRGRAVETRHTR